MINSPILFVQGTADDVNPYSFSQKLYEAAARDANATGTSASGQTTGASGASDEEIVDAEIVDEK